MSDVAFIQLDLGGVLRHTMTDLPANGARWDASTTPTIQLYRPGGGAILSAPASTTTTSTTTLSSSAAAGATSLTVGSTAGIDRWADLVVGPSSSTGRWEWITVAAAAGQTITLAAPLTYAYPSGTVVKSHEMTYTVASTACSSIERGCRAEWRYEVNDVPRRESTIYHVSRYAPRLALSAAELIQEYPRAARQIASHQDLDLMIRRIWSRTVLPTIHRIYPPGAVMAGSEAEQALAAAVKVALCEEAKDAESAEIYREQFRNAIDEIARYAVDLDESGDVGDSEIPRSTRAIRVLRG